MEETYCINTWSFNMRDDFDCVQAVILPIIPSIFFWFMIPIFCLQVYRIRAKGGENSQALPWTALMNVKIIIVLYLLLVEMLILIINIRNIVYKPLIDFIYPAVTACTMLGIFLCILWARKSGMVTSGILHITWFLFALCKLPEYVTCWQKIGNVQLMQDTDSARFIIIHIRYPFIIIQMVLFCFADLRQPFLIEKNRKSNQSPELSSSFLNRLTLWWFTQIPLLGVRKTLTNDDLYQLNEGNTAFYLSAKWEKLWTPAVENYLERKKKCGNAKEKAFPELLEKSVNSKSGKSANSEFEKNVEPQPPSVIWRLFLMFRFEILAATAIKMLSDILQFASPFFLNLLLNYISSRNRPLSEGIAFVFGMFVCAEIRSFLLNYYFYLMLRVSVKIQTTLTTAIYRKILRLSNSARKGRSVGEIMNLMAIDVERFQNITLQIQQFWSCPFQITLVLIYLFFVLGASAGCGVFVMILYLPLNIVTSVIIKKWQTEQMRLKDKRTKICNEILNGIKVIKLYAWEIPMEEAVERIRNKELDLVRKAGLLRAITDSLNVSSPFFVALLTFATYTLTSPTHILTPQIAFVSLTLFNQLRSPMTMINLLLQMTVQTLVSNKRVRSFLTADELNFSTVDRSSTDECDNLDNAVEVKDAQLSWDSKDSSVPISDIKDFTLPKGFLVAVVGKVGSGKSTLLDALLGEMEKLKGYIGVHGQVALISQQPWIQNLTLRDNILFGKKFDQEYYDKVVEACALVKDISILPSGDTTEIGEKGINLSGGQKARLALARAVYQDCDVYLLDDPLSAVDSHVGKSIFEKVIGPNGLLRNKTRIFVTNNLTYLDEADVVAYMKDGKLVAYGPYEKLLDESKSFADFIEDCHKQNTEEEKSNEDNKTDVMSAFDESISETAAYDEFKSEEEGRGKYVNAEFDRVQIQSSLIRRSSSDGHQLSQSEARFESPRYASNALIDKYNEKRTELINIEKVLTGKVKFGVYVRYVRSATVLTAFLFIFFYLTYAGLQMGRGLWLSAWLGIFFDILKLMKKIVIFCESDLNINLNTFVGLYNVYFFWSNAAIGSKADQLSLGTRLKVYASFGFAEGVSFLCALIYMVRCGLKASRNLHAPLLHNLLRSPMSFFDRTPVGRILNRLCKDIDVIDQLLPSNFRYFIHCLQNVGITLLIIVLSTPAFCAVILPLTAIYYASLHFYLPTSRQLRRLESINRSLIYQHFSETTQGVTCIRAFDKVREFSTLTEVHVDRFICSKYTNILSNRWLAIRLEFIGNCVILFAALFAILSERWGSAINAGIAGLSVTYALNITETLNFTVRQIGELETNIVAVERVQEYTETPAEAEWRLENFKPEKTWPSEGQITLKDYSTSYHLGYGLVLRQLNAFIEPAEKIAIVGRTGAGKSSLALALFRIVEPLEGTIIIDDVDIRTIGLHDLRSNLTIIPQEPVLFSETIRFNLDPFGTYSDQEVWRALEMAHLKTFVSSFAEGLQYHISESGENISVGQRQLICLARALLRKSKVLVLDEATAAVDFATDLLIQETIRSEFQDSTVLTIAHRLNTILDYDRVMVLDSGTICEFDSPQNLLANRSSVFFSMASDAHIVS